MGKLVIVDEDKIETIMDAFGFDPEANSITLSGELPENIVMPIDKIVVTPEKERINLFADATLDHQWIHVDTEKAAVESPFKSTIAHGYLTLSMLPYMWNQIIEVNNLKMMINYGMDKMKFGQAVLSGQSIRLRTTLQTLQNLRGTAKAEIKFKIEIEGQKKPALEGVAIFLYYFEN